MDVACRALGVPSVDEAPSCVERSRLLVTTARIASIISGRIGCELQVADGVFGICRLSSKQQARVEAVVEEKRPDLASMTALLAARWKQGKITVAEPARAGQIRSFGVAALGPSAKRIELELAGLRGARWARLVPGLRRLIPLLS